MKETVHGFREVDHAADAQYFIQFLDEIGSIESVREGKRLMLEVLGIRTGQRILDIGCGVGDDVIEMARLVGKTGRVVGLDSSQVMVAEARRRSEGLSSWATPKTWSFLRIVSTLAGRNGPSCTWMQGALLTR